MRNDFTNLLPIERRHALRRDYFLRLAVVTILLITALVLAAGALLVPAYVFLVQSAHAKAARLVTIEAALSSNDDAGLSTRLATLARNAATLAKLADAPSVSSTLRETLGVAHPDVALTSFIYTSATTKTPATLALSGIAATRNALRGYQLALQGASFIRSADLPVSAYAKDTNNVFTITVILTP